MSAQIHTDIEALEAGTPQALEHAASCDECGRELAWLKAERALMARRPQPSVNHLWAGIERQIGRRPHRPHWAWRTAVAAAGLAAAASVLFVVLKPAPPTIVPQPIARRERVKPDAKALAALDRAEADYRDAAKVLEAEYARLRPGLDTKVAERWDETLTRAHTQLGEARAVAGEDVNARMQVLDGYAGYLRSLRNVIEQSEEANP
ncbi:MAG: hypothetical protein ABR567_11135 [Myxococcales bacterium]|nr:hypothetical protein [Myxococcales bacterium]